MLTPVIDQDLCIGCGLCTSLAPKTFAMGDGGSKAIVLEVSEMPDSEERIRNAVESCPAHAITLSE